MYKKKKTKKCTNIYFGILKCTKNVQKKKQLKNVQTFILVDILKCTKKCTNKKTKKCTNIYFGIL